jgi:TolB-like protein/DNA-binding winged helix-turn-helix (wHTH) protein/Flp pilus assembly protein TadD
MQVPANHQPSRVRFAEFEIDRHTGELWKRGKKVRLQDQPFQVLRLLLDRPGELVTRDELKQILWPSDTFVDFDDGLNTAVRKLRDALGDSADEPRFVETVPKRGYRFVASLTEQADAVSPPATQDAKAGPKPENSNSNAPGSGLSAGHKSWFHRRARVVLAAATTLAIIAGGLVLYRKNSDDDSKRPAIKSLAVLPLANLSGDPSQEYLADGMTEALIGRLSDIRDLRVISRTSVMRFRGTQLSVPEIARTLQVDAVVEGSVIRDGNHIRVQAELIRAATDEHFWSESYDRELPDVLSLESEVAQSVAQKIAVTITGDEGARLRSARAVDPEAYNDYMKGRYYWNRRTADGLRKAALYFEQATSKDPAYGAAYSGLADCNSGLAWHGFVAPGEALPKAYAAAQKAVEIDPGSAEAHASLALVLDHKWDWPEAEVEFKRAIELNPQYANAHHWYGDYLSIHGRHADALAEANRALELDPLNLMIGTWVGLRYYSARRYSDAIAQSRSTADLDPDFAAAHLILGESYVQEGNQEGGVKELRKAVELSGDSPLYEAQVGVGLALSGQKKEAQGVIRGLQRISGKRYVSPYGIAQIYAAMDEKSQTYEWLESAYRDRAVWMSYLAVDPLFDSIRPEPHFQDLLRRVGVASHF